MQIPRFTQRRARAALRFALSYYITIGLSAALGLLLISSAVHLFVGAFAASAASVGVIVCIPPDQPAPRRGKFWQLLPAALIGLPLFFGVQVLHATPVHLGLLLVPATFIAFLAGAWGKRGLPIAVSIMFAMIFSMAMPGHSTGGSALSSSLYFALGAGCYLVWATLANAALNARYRVQMLADTLLSLTSLMRTQSRQFTPAAAEERGRHAPLIGQLLKQQAALTDQLQMARNILLESPRTPRRQQLAGMLIQVLEMRDHLLACELDLDTLKAHPGHAPVLDALREVLDALADEIEQLADALLAGRKPPPVESRRPQLAVLYWGEDAPPSGNKATPSPAMLARGLANRVGNINDETLRLIALARGEAKPDLAVVRAAWQMFVSPTAWSWRPFFALWRWDAPPLRHAIRAALAVGSAYLLSLGLPWGTHDYWILLTIVVVLRGSLAQTLERRNSRVAGTLIGCILAAALLSMHAPVAVLLGVVTLAQAVAHALAIRRYLVTAVAATVLGLVQAHMLNAELSPAFDVIERMADTLIGVAIAWAFSYVLPSWERTQIPALVARTLSAQVRHARVSLGLGQLQAVDNEPELEWRLARREAYDSLSALVQATQRSLSEPRAVRPPLEPLGRLLAHSYQLLAQLTSVKTMLLLRRGRLNAEQIRAPLMQTAEIIEATLIANPPATAADAPCTDASPGPVALPDPFESDLSPWVLRRLHLAASIAMQLRDDANQVLRPPNT
ncbi:FUSC family protein [Polaromonas jejuensis]|uniref:FUSC family membrane protein n=1 Tax=Polaromonas jejuensis TaxID=457502 RepID=A0ABW0QA26_9BURK|nr:FUSC family membrane protein [Polaromonas jejuensis]